MINSKKHKGYSTFSSFDETLCDSHCKVKIFRTNLNFNVEKKRQSSSDNQLRDKIISYERGIDFIKHMLNTNMIKKHSYKKKILYDPPVLHSFISNSKTNKNHTRFNNESTQSSPFRLQRTFSSIKDLQSDCKQYDSRENQDDTMITKQPIFSYRPRKMSVNTIMTNPMKNDSTSLIMLNDEIDERIIKPVKFKYNTSNKLVHKNKMVLKRSNVPLLASFSLMKTFTNKSDNYNFFPITHFPEKLELFNKDLYNPENIKYERLKSAKSTISVFKNQKKYPNHKSSNISSRDRRNRYSAKQLSLKNVSSGKKIYLRKKTDEPLECFSNPILKEAYKQRLGSHE